MTPGAQTKRLRGPQSQNYEPMSSEQLRISIRAQTASAAGYERDKKFARWGQLAADCRERVEAMTAELVRRGEVL